MKIIIILAIILAIGILPELTVRAIEMLELKKYTLSYDKPSVPRCIHSRMAIMARSEEEAKAKLFKLEGACYIKEVERC